MVSFTSLHCLQWILIFAFAVRALPQVNPNLVVGDPICNDANTPSINDNVHCVPVISKIPKNGGPKGYNDFTSLSSDAIFSIPEDPCVITVRGDKSPENDGVPWQWVVNAAVKIAFACPEHGGVLGGPMVGSTAVVVTLGTPSIQS